MQEYSQLFEPYRLDDWSAAEDAAGLAQMIHRLLGRFGLHLCMTEERLARQILQYIWMRMAYPAHEISVPQHERGVPDGWTRENEEIWLDWISMKIDLDQWKPEVLQPVFGSDERTWEAFCPGWRDELFAFLPYWIARSKEKLEKIDPTPLPDPEPEEKDPRLAKIDPYLLEHGKRGRRIKGVRTFD